MPEGGDELGIELAPQLLVGDDTAGETLDREAFDRGLRRAVDDQVGHDRADAGRELEAVAAETEGVQEPRRGPAPADHGQHVRQVALDARPDAARAHAPEARDDLGEAGKPALDAVRRNDGRARSDVGLHAREGAGHRLAVAARPQQQRAVDGMQRRAGIGVLRRDREQRRPGGEHRHRLAELPRDVARPGAGGVDDLAARHGVPLLGAQGEPRARPLHG